MPLKDSGLATLWAARKVDSLFDSLITGARESEIKPQVMALALEHKLLTKYTSFVAIEERAVRPQGEPALDKQVPNLMPGGNTMAIPFPVTATSAKFSFYLGIIFLFCAFLFHYRYRAS
jgi:Ca-activated chloride channel family protein